jgi:hypothetical protein
VKRRKKYEKKELGDARGEGKGVTRREMCVGEKSGKSKIRK